MSWTLLNMKQEGSVITNNILILDLIKFTGNKKISMWTKQTFRQRPFSLVNYIDWTEQPTKAVQFRLKTSSLHPVTVVYIGKRMH